MIRRDEYFFSRLGELTRGEIAALRRNAGNTIGEARGIYSIFYRILPPDVTDNHTEEIFFLVATLYGYNEYQFSGDVGLTMRCVKTASGSESIDKRMIALLDCDDVSGGEFAYRLAQCVRLANSCEVGVDWPRLLHDLERWQQPGKPVQKQWARSYFSDVNQDDENEENIKGA